MDSSLKALVDEWLVQDKNEETRAEIVALVEKQDVKELEKRMRNRIEFGTAGLRGKMEAGWSRMNDLTVIQASQGLCAYVEKNVASAKSKGFVVGHDHRHHSKHWAQLSAMVFINRGFKVYFLEGLVHTPLVPFTIGNKKAACGVMITASHNPKQDNGYKVYWENAVQIIAPHDTGIAEEIKRNLQPQSWDTRVLGSSEFRVDVTEEVTGAYFSSIAQLSTSRTLKTPTSLKFVNTSMHGVGHRFVEKAFETFGLPPVIPVLSQKHPDPDFPTLAFPNPEEKGALDLAIQDADANDATYVLAQDPDADRFCAAEKSANGKWRIFTGDQLGAIFAARCFEAYQKSGKAIDKMAMVASTVSSKMIEAMAAREGFKFVECLTGFKYIGNTALRLESEGFEVPFGYEEAIGFMLGSTARDKDGVSASAFFAELAIALHEQGLSVTDYLQGLYKKYGFFKTSNGYFISNDPVTTDRIFARLRSYNYTTDSRGANYPQTIADLKITNVRDLTVGYDSSNPPSYKPDLPLSSGHMITFRAMSGSDQVKITLTIRTSGTEPKIKYYLEGSGSDQLAVDRILSNVISDLTQTWMEASKNNLIAT